MNYLIRTFVLVGVVLATNTVHGIEYSAVQADKSTIAFTSRQMGVPVQGRFPKFTSRIAFDPAKPESAKVDISIDLASIDAGSQDANDEVVGKQWFNVKMFPVQALRPTPLRQLAPGATK